jgi:SAM-dependent methyltransferase
MSLILSYHSVFDVGCGHGDFTLRMAKHANSIIGVDNAIEMIKIAEAALQETTINNLQFIYATTKEDLPFMDGQFDLIYVRRGPTSIINHSRILSSGGTILGIHSGALDTVRERLLKNNLINIEIREYDEARICFPNELEFAKFIAGIPGNLDYTNPEYKEELDKKIEENTVNGRLELKEYKYIWKAEKP